jgi:hypothetical protein
MQIPEKAESYSNSVKFWKSSRALTINCHSWRTSSPRQKSSGKIRLTASWRRQYNTNEHGRLWLAVKQKNFCIGDHHFL